MPMQRPQIKKGVFSRLVKMLFSFYPKLVPITIGCIIFSSVASSIPDMYIHKVIKIIVEALESGWDWSKASEQIVPMMMFLIMLYLISTVAITVYSQLMAVITQGFLNKMRQAMFKKMQNLPVRYFDTHKHGEIMSYYTNDIDTLRQLISQGLPTLFRAGTVVIAVFFIMMYYSFWLTLLTIAGVIAMMFVSKVMGGGSAKYFLI